MPDFDAVLDGFTAGDDLEVRRTVSRAASDMDAGEVLLTAWMTAKTSLEDDDADALFQKEISTADVPGTGQIENDGGSGEDPVLRFDLGPADTAKLGPSAKHYDISFRTDNGKVYTVEVGEAVGATQATRATS